MRLEIGGEPLRILDFDVEARPLSWFGGDFVTKEITAIACAWIVDGEAVDLDWRLLNRSDGSSTKMLRWFLERYAEADMVTGHFIRGYDLPVINGMLIEKKLPLLSDKLTHDTKLDGVKRSGISNSQENLGAMLGLEHPKIDMTQADWRAANRLTKAGLERTRQRVTGDVVQHVEMREKMIQHGMLGRPRVWTPSPNGMSKGYTP